MILCTSGSLAGCQPLLAAAVTVVMVHSLRPSHGLAASHLAQAPVARYGSSAEPRIVRVPVKHPDLGTPVPFVLVTTALQRASTPPRHSALVYVTRPRGERTLGGIESTISGVRDGPSPAALPSERPYFSHGAISPPRATDFGLQLAAAARWQTNELVIYTARYQRIAYPMGDLAPLHGACTDVVVRAYRALGIDLQKLVYRAGVGSGDPNIDHRRTETLRRFFARHGQVLPVTAFPEDYRPGDIVTYHRPFSRVSRSHIAIVSDVLAPTNRPMIVHNRGWGPQLEDALFADRITGHYRFHPSRTTLGFSLTFPAP
jgi:uncharacterized protein YijF (DUF1287 family)